MEIVDILQLLVPNVWTTITQLLATALLFFLMYKLAWGPVKKILDTRSEYEQSRLEEAERLRSENEKINAEAQNIIAQANEDAQDILRNAHEEGTALKNELIEEGRQESRQMMDNAQRDMKMQKEKMMGEMHNQIVDAALTAAEKMLQGKIESEGDKESIDSFVKEVISK